jgi:hypothetical protein
VAVALIAAATALACGDEGSAVGQGGNGGGLGGRGLGGVPAVELPFAPCTETDGVGRFEIELNDAEGYTSVYGKVGSGVSPAPLPEELGREGECRLLRDVPTSCDPGCVGGEVCSPRQTCLPEPRNRSVGTVTVYGLVIDVRMNPNEATWTYSNPAQPALPHPGFLPGADLRIVTAGGDYAPFELRGWGVSALVLGPETIDVVAGQPTRLTWLPPDMPGPTRLHAELNINNHGSTKAKIECDFADTGAAEIPASLIDGLIAQGVSGFPTLRAERRSATSEQIEPGCVDLLVLSAIETSIQVEGITSCNEVMPCPLGQTCISVEFFCE